jgi:flagellar hook protein FlgE
MSLNTALSGLQAAQSGLDVSGNNLSNAATTGFKSGSAEFQTLYAAGSANAPGEGVSNQFIQQNFSQGNLTTTGNPLDLAIQGNGFFIVQSKGQNTYTRDGAFQLSPNGQLQDALGNAVLGFGVNSTGASNGILTPLSVSTSDQSANPTAKVGLSTALNSADPVMTTAFSPTNPATYDESTSVVAYDSMGNANHVQLYFAKNPAASGSAAAPSNWSIYAQPEAANTGSAVGTPTKLTTLSFNANGTLAGGGSATLPINWGNGAAKSNVAFDFTGTTLGAQQFAVNSITNNGFAPGQFTGTQISKTGDVQATYSNGQTKTVGSVAIASFINQQGLEQQSGNLFLASQTSGVPVVNPPATGVNGSLVAGSLEQSNTQTSTELVNLIKFQQAFQANSTVIQTDQADFSKLLQL